MVPPLWGTLACREIVKPLCHVNFKFLLTFFGGEFSFFTKISESNKVFATVFAILIFF